MVYDAPQLLEIAEKELEEARAEIERLKAVQEESRKHYCEGCDNRGWFTINGSGSESRYIHSMGLKHGFPKSWLPPTDPKWLGHRLLDNWEGPGMGCDGDEGMLDRCDECYGEQRPWALEIDDAEPTAFAQLGITHCFDAQVTQWTILPALRGIRDALTEWKATRDYQAKHLTDAGTHTPASGEGGRTTQMCLDAVAKLFGCGPDHQLNERLQEFADALAEVEQICEKSIDYHIKNY